MFLDKFSHGQIDHIRFVTKSLVIELNSKERFAMSGASFLLLITLAANVGRPLCLGSFLGSLRKDCGAQSGYFQDLSYWDADEKYVKSGDNKDVPPNNINSVTQLNSLRYFEKGKRNCYTLPVTPSWSYNVKASFYYGNYDDRSRPPTFGLVIEGIEGASVETSSTTVVYHEVIYTARRNKFSLCLVRSKGKHGHPFINALEMSPLFSYKTYQKMNHDLTWFCRFRYSFGSDETVLGYPDDTYNRVWERIDQSSGQVPVAAGATLFYNNCNEVPDTVLNRAVEVPSPIDSLDLQLDFADTEDDHLYYMTFYFTSMHYDNTRKTGSNSFDFYISGIRKATILTEFSYCTCWSWVDVRLNNTKVLHIEFRPNGNTSFPPAINAMEVFWTNLSEPAKRRNVGLIIGLPIGMVLGLSLLGIFIYFVVLKRPGPVRGRPTRHSTGGTMGAEPTVGDPGQGFDQEELDELLYLHFTARQTRLNLT